MNDPGGPARLEVREHKSDHRGGVESVRVSLRVPVELRWLEGHFCGDPILAAVVQVREALCFVRASWPDLPRLARIRRAKFRSPIRPLDELVLQLQRRSDDPRVTFEYSRGGAACSGGSLEFE